MSFSYRQQIKSPATTACSGAVGLLQRKCACGGSPGPTAECKECREKRSQRHATNETGPTAAPLVVHDVLRSPGQPLDAATRNFMEPRFGHDFGHVRVHTDAKAGDSARAVHAHAYTVGHNVVFGKNEFAPATHPGRELLAHELAHTIQQGNGSGTLRLAKQNGILESSAVAAGRDISDGRFVSRELSRSGLALARQPTSSGGSEDQQLAEELERLRAKLKKEASYPGRDKDLDRYYAIKPIVQKGGRARAAAVDEALAVAAEIEQELHEHKEEEPTPVPMALPIGKGGRAAAPRAAPQKPRHDPPSKFGPGGFRDDDVKAIAEAEKLERKRKIAEDAERINNDPVWTIPGGIGRTEYGRAMWRQMQHYYRSPHTGPGLLTEEAPGAAFFTSEIFHDWFFGGQAKVLERFEEKPLETYNQIQWLTLWLTEKGQERGQLIAMFALALIPQRLPGGPGSSSRPSGGGGRARFSLPAPSTRAMPRPSAPVEATDAEVVAANVRNPSSIRPTASAEHQETWRQLGGSSPTAPPAFHDQEGNIHISNDHPLLAPATRAGIPAVSPGRQTPATPTPARVQAGTSTTPAEPRSGIGVPEAISEEAVTQRNPMAGPTRAEVVGDFEISGSKGLKDQTFEREIWGFKNLKGKTREIEPLRQLGRDFIQEARAAGATQLRITGNAVRNPNVLKMKLFAREFGGTVRTTGSIATQDAWIEVIIPL